MSFSENYKKCLLKTLKHEGGYVNDPDDPGAETVFGISRRFHSDWIGWKIIDQIDDKNKINLDFLKENEELFDSVAKFYFTKFYQRIKAVKIEKVSSELACNVFDFAVNAGFKTSGIALQNAINKKLKELNLEKIVVDGIIGNQTLGALGSIQLRDKAKCYLKEVVFYFKEERALYYTKLTIKKPIFLKFLKGWMKRAFNV